MFGNVVFRNVHALGVLPDFARLAHDHKPTFVAV